VADVLGRRQALVLGNVCCVDIHGHLLHLLDEDLAIDLFPCRIGKDFLERLDHQLHDATSGPLEAKVLIQDGQVDLVARVLDHLYELERLRAFIGKIREDHPATFR
jgi:hypothetical protein